MRGEAQKILVTGGAGFIGSHLCERLLSEGCEVICLDNFNDFYDPIIKRNNIRKALAHERYTLKEGDIRDVELLNDLFAQAKPNVVIHLAAMAGVQPSLEDPELYYDVNVMGTLKLLQACVKYGIDKFIFASSSSVYGNNPVPFKESDNTDKSISPYAATKKAGEVMCYVFHHLHSMSIHCLRFFTVVGPRQRPDLAVHKFVKLITQGKPVQLRGDLSSCRDYTSVYDTIDGIMGSLNRLNKAASPEYKIYNLGNSYPIRLDEMLKTIEDTLGQKAKVEYTNFMQGDVEQTFADISLAQEEIGYEPRRRFGEAVEGVVRFSSFEVVKI